MITLSAPSKEEREALVKSPNFPSFFAGEVYMQDSVYYNEHPDELEKIQDKFVALTDGFSFTELNGLRRLCKNEKIRIPNLCDVIDLYKYPNYYTEYCFRKWTCESQWEIAISFI